MSYIGKKIEELSRWELATLLASAAVSSQFPMYVGASADTLGLARLQMFIFYSGQPIEGLRETLTDYGRSKGLAANHVWYVPR